MKIILLEDDLQLQESLTLALTIKNHEVCCIESVKQAKAINYDNYDLTILDIQLPDGNGIDVCRMIRKQYHLPIIFLTANDLESTIIEGLNAGGDDYITKPFSLNILYYTAQYLYFDLNLLKSLNFGHYLIKLLILTIVFLINLEIHHK